MANQRVSGAAGPEHERRAGRRLAIPFLFVAVLVAVVMAGVLLVTQPWEGSEVNQRDVPPAATTTP